MLKRLRSALVSHPFISAAVAVGLLAGLAAGAVPAFSATEQPSFCRSCHEMNPYHDAWSAGAHRSVACVECHVDAGTVAHVTHKAIAAKELWVHLTGDPKFPTGAGAPPDERCLRCHPDGRTLKTVSGFDHAKHTGTGPCVTCHRDTGHLVTSAALAREGVLRAGAEATAPVAGVPPGVSVAAAATAETTPSAESSRGVHVATSCSTCHDQLKEDCSTCHTPAHKARTGACVTCHAAGVRWAFRHPANDACTTCHAVPAKHLPGTCTTCHAIGRPFKDVRYTHTGGACSTCHTAPTRHRAGDCSTCHRAGSSWSFAHPGAGSACTACHKAPARHRGGACQTCHRRAGVSWAFAHPSSNSCASCHKAPAKHYGASCSSCHKVGVPFRKAVFRHVWRSGCSSCHKAPSGHRSGACESCHRNAGSNWAFSHPSSTSCSSCHKAPSGHYGTSCSSCHSPSRAWSNATFTHPRLQEHTYKSFACSSCHPSGYSSASCTSCHKNGAPSDD